MGGMHRDDRPALIALAMLLFCLLLVVALESSFRYSPPNPPPQQSTSDIQADQGHGKNVAWHYSGAPVTEWMMVILTAAGVVISASAVKLVNDTLRENQKAANAAIDAVTTTREIADRQLRPYVVYQASKMRLYRPADTRPEEIEIDIEFKNAGLTPAVVTAFSSAIYGPIRSGEWGSKGRNWQSTRMIVGQGHGESVSVRGPQADIDGNFSAFAIGVLFFYQSLSGEKYEDHVWLALQDGTLRQGSQHSSFDLYRPDF